MASLSINPDALPNICPYPRDRTNKRTGYDDCAGQLISHFPVISDLKLFCRLSYVLGNGDYDIYWFLCSGLYESYVAYRDLFYNSIPTQSK